MFQSLAGDFKEKNHSKDVNFNGEDIKATLKKLFSIPNIIIYVISFLISMVSFGGDVSLGITPFSLAIVAAAASNGIPMGIMYLVTLVGSYIGLGQDITINYFFTSIVFFASLFIIKAKKQTDDNEKVKLGKNLVLSILIVKIVPMIFTSMNLGTLIFSIMLSVITYIFYKIFVNAIDVVYEYGYKKVFSIEELIGASLLLAIALSALSPIAILGYSLKNILCILIVLILGWKCGILFGTTGGVTIGIVLGIIGNENPITVAAFAIAGMLSGIFSKIGKIGVIIGFIAGNILITYVSKGNVEPIIVFQEILIASLGLLLIPKKAEYVIDDIFESTKILPEMTSRSLDESKESKETVSKLDNISKTISEIAKSFNEAAATTVVDAVKNKNKKQLTFRKELISQIEDLDENILYYDLNNSEEIVNDIYTYLTNNKKLTKDALITIFAKHNNYIVGADSTENSNVEDDINEMLDVINKSFEKSQTNIVIKEKIKEKNKDVSTQLQGVSEVISDLAEDIKNDEKDEFKVQKSQIKKMLQSKGIIIEEINIKVNDSGRKVVTIFSKNEDVENYFEANIKYVERVLNKILQDKMVLQKNKKKENILDVQQYVFMAKDMYSLKIGVGRSKKFDSTVSGDTTTQTKLSDGKILLAISDGMGSGPEARKCSKIAIKMLEKMLSTGFKKDSSVKMINSILSSNNEEDMYATLDISILDLYKGNMELIKNGACPTYIKRNKSVELIKSDSLPTGLVKDIDLDVFEKDLQAGDIIVMCSDGIIESKQDFTNKELWLQYLLEEIQSEDVQQIADLIISEAIDNDFGKEKDDMTVIVAKITN